MALVLADRVQVTTSTTGTGTLTLGSAVNGFQDFTVIGDGNTTYYAITNSTAWEVGIGTYTASGTTLARTTILSNSNGDTSPITLSGDSNVFVTYPAVAASDAALPSQTSNAGKYLQTDGTDATWENGVSLDSVNSWSKGQSGAVVALTDAATVGVNLALANNFSLLTTDAVGASRAMGNPSNAVAGQSGLITITQDGSGSRLLTYSANWKFAGGSAPTLSTVANTVDYLAYYVETSTRVYLTLIKAVS